MKRISIPSALAVLSVGYFGAVSHFAMAESAPSDQDIADAYIYLLGRLHVTRQQQLHFQEGFKWNEIIHRKPGAVDWPNPNLDVAYSEAWVAVDESSCTIVSVRYLLNEQTQPQRGADGSLTLYFAAEKPANAPEGNWLPTPKGSVYRLTLRFYGPLDGVANGTYYPPALVKTND